ncbi:MAG: hypothetical protein ABJI60_04535 [Kangiellaceae bacterium]
MTKFNSKIATFEAIATLRAVTSLQGEKMSRQTVPTEKLLE